MASQQQNQGQDWRNTSLRAVVRSLGGRRKPLYAVSGIVEAPVDTVRRLITRVAEGEAGDGNALLLADPSAKIVLKGGPDRFRLPYGFVEVDRGNGSLAVMGNWWYRGVFSAEPHPKGARLVLRVYNHAKRFRLFVPMTQFGFSEMPGKTLDAALKALSSLAGLKAYRED